MLICDVCISMASLASLSCKCICSTFDQYSNIVLHQCVERVVSAPYYGDEHLGTQILRGEHIVLMGTLKYREMRGMQLKSVKEVREHAQKEKELKGISALDVVRDDEDFGLY